MQIELTKTELENIITSVQNSASAILEKMEGLEGSTCPAKSNLYNLMMDEVDALDNLLEKLEVEREKAEAARSTASIADDITSAATHWR